MHIFMIVIFKYEVSLCTYIKRNYGSLPAFLVSWTNKVSKISVTLNSKSIWKYLVNMKVILGDPGAVSWVVRKLKRPSLQERKRSSPCKIRTGILVGSRWNLGEIPAGIPARFLPRSEILGGQNLAGIVLQISPRFSPGSKNPGGQNLTRILPRISPRFSLGSNNPGS